MLFENLKLSLKSLWAHKMRSFLTVLSITIGVAAIVAMTSLAKSGLATLTRGIEEIGGTRFIWIVPDEPEVAAEKRGSYAGRMTWGDRDAIAGAVGSLESIVASKRFYHVAVSAGGTMPVRTTVLATEPSYFGAYKMRLATGRALNEADMRDRRKAMVIGATLATKLFGTPEAVGRELRFNGDRFEVIGVLKANQKSGVRLGYDWDELAILPFTAPGVGHDVEEISMTVRRTEDGEQAIKIANSVLLHRHHGVDNFQFLDFGGLLKNFYLAFAAMRVVVGLIAGVALLIGGVGVMNIMLVAVNERMREIGLRKALGATKAVIRGQFLTEAIVLTLFGALVGVVLGVGLVEGATVVITMLNPTWVASFSYEAVAVAVAASGAIGLFFGWYPARQAAELEPIQALRHE